jgi:hypothetical protein
VAAWIRRFPECKPRYNQKSWDEEMRRAHPLSAWQRSCRTGLLDFAIHVALEYGGDVPNGRKPEDGRTITATTWLNSQPPRILREPGGTSRKATAVFHQSGRLVPEIKDPLIRVPPRVGLWALFRGASALKRKKAILTFIEPRKGGDRSCCKSSRIWRALVPLSHPPSRSAPQRTGYLRLRPEPVDGVSRRLPILCGQRIPIFTPLDPLFFRCPVL